MHNASKNESLCKKDGETKWMNFLIKDDNLLKQYDTGIKSAIVSKKNLNENPSTIFFFF